MITINKELLKRSSTYINIGIAVLTSLAGMGGIFSQETISVVLTMNSVLLAAQAVTVQLGKV